MAARTRKPAADPADAAAAPAEDKAVTDETAADTLAAVEDKAVAADTETKAPEVAPLDPPAAPEPPTAHEGPIGPDGLVPAELGDCIVDEATGAKPTDPDMVFELLPPFGHLCRSRVRLVEYVGMGAYKTPTTRLLVPAGADLRREDADRIVVRLRKQLGE